MVKILGYKRKNGSFTNEKNENINFDNYSFYFLTDEENNVQGYSTELRGVRLINVPVARLKEISGYDDPSSLIGKTFRPYYQLSYGRVRLVSLDEVKSK